MWPQDQTSIFSLEQVKALKEKIEAERGKDNFPVSGQKLIYAGKILQDDMPIKDYKIDEKNFVVVMVSKVRLTPISTLDLIYCQQSVALFFPRIQYITRDLASGRSLQNLYCPCISLTLDQESLHCISSIQSTSGQIVAQLSGTIG